MGKVCIMYKDDTCDHGNKTKPGDVVSSHVVVDQVRRR